MYQFKRLLSLLLAIIMCLSVTPLTVFASADENNYVKRNSFTSDIFSDVKESDWFYDNVKVAYELGLMLGKGEKTFDTENGITIAETITIAARLHSIYHSGDDSFEASDPWYKAYVDYADVNDIVTFDMDDFSKSATRAEFAGIIGNALPDEALEEMNKVADDSIPDVKTPDTYSDAVYKLYRAGIMTGNDENGTFAPASEIKRSEVAAIVTRMAVKELRQSVQLGNEYTVSFDMNGHGEQISEQIVVEGYTVKKPVNPKESHYDFKGWYTDKADADKYDFSEPVNDDMTLYARWEMDSEFKSLIVGMISGHGSDKYENTYTVSFDTNGGSVVKSQNIEYGETVTVPYNPKKDGFVFAGWYTDNIESNYENYYDFSRKLKTDIVLYAKWIDITDTTDSDEDGLTDPVEAFYKTDKTNADTDGDELSDFVEITILGLNPLMLDTDANDINDGEEDSDNDEIINKNEIINGTDPCSKDTDMDGINDNDEICYNTNAISADTDDDGVSDGKEIEIGTDPLVPQITFSMNVSADNYSEGANASVQINLSGEQVETLSVQAVKNEMFFPETMPGYMGNAYDFNVDGVFQSATISFEFDHSQLNSNADPVIYYINEETQRLEELETTVIGNVASAEVTHFSKYILIDRSIYEESFEWIDVWDSDQSYTGVEVVLVIDDSGSMDYNDMHNQRLLVAQNMVDNLPDNSKIGIVKFENSTTILTPTLTSDKETAKTYLTTTYFKSSGGTYMYHAINDAFALYESSDESIMKVMIVLSDGETSGTYYHESTIESANSNDVRIYTVGLGDSISYFNKYLKPLAINTGAAFYLASDADQLADIYNSISQKIDIETDSDEDNIPDYYEENMIVFSGVKLSLDKNNPDTDGDGLLDGEEIELEYDYNSDETKVKVTGKILLGNPLNEDTDGDGLLDSDDKSPLVWDVCDRDLATFAALVYESESDYNSGNIDKDYYFLDYMNNEELDIIRENWDLIENLTEKQWCDIDTYFEAATFKNNNSVIIAIRGTDENFGEWVNNILGYGVFNWHVEEAYAKQYAKKVAKQYPNCDLYITGHSLGGYLTQHAATALHESGYSENVKRIAYFNGMGLDTKFLIFDSMKKEQKALTHYSNENKLYCYRIDGDVVSALGEHFVTPKSFPPTQSAINNHKGKHGDTQVEFKLWYLLSPLSATIDMLKAGGAMTMEYIWYTHETDSFFYHLAQGTRDYR